MLVQAKGQNRWNRWIGGFDSDGNLCQVFPIKETAENWLRGFEKFGHYLKPIVVCIRKRTAKAEK